MSEKVTERGASSKGERASHRFPGPGGGRVSWARATMATYFKSSRIVVDPPEPLKILWLVELPRAGASTVCAFSEARNWACSDGTRDAADLENEIAALGVFLDDATALCHHLSYVRTDAELGAKVRSFAHAADVRTDWLETTWRAWDADPNLEDLHPTHPPAFKRTASQPIFALPPALRRLVEAAAGDDGGCADALYCRLSRVQSIRPSFLPSHSPS